MAEGGKYFQSVYNIHIHTVQKDDKTDVRVERTETHIIDSNIEQVNVRQQEANNDVAENHINEDQVEIIQGENEMNLSSSSRAPIVVKKKGRNSSDQKANNAAADDTINEEQKDTVQSAGEMNLPSSSRAPISARKKERTSSDQVSGPFNQKKLPDVEKRKSLRIEIIEEEFASLCARSEFERAVTCIEQLTSEQRKNVGLNTLLRMAECYAELGRDRKAEKTIETATCLFPTSPSDVDDVIKHAGELIVDKSYFRALVLLRISSDMYARNSSLTPNDIVEGIYECARKMHFDVIDPMIKSGGRLKIFAVKNGCTFMSEMIGMLRAVENADLELKAKWEAYCFEWLGYDCDSAKDYEKSIKFRKTGVDAMKRQFGKNASKYQIYVGLLNNLGNSNARLGRYSIAEGYYTKALDAFNNASDFSNHDEKQKLIEIAQINLKRTRKKMK